MCVFWYKGSQIITFQVDGVKEVVWYHNWREKIKKSNFPIQRFDFLLMFIRTKVLIKQENAVNILWDAGVSAMFTGEFWLSENAGTPAHIGDK